MLSNLPAKTTPAPLHARKLVMTIPPVLLLHTTPVILFCSTALSFPKAHQQNSTLDHRYWTGPYQVTRVIDDITIQVQDPNTLRRQVVHADRLKRFLPRPEPPPNPIQYAPVIHPPDHDQPVLYLLRCGEP
eukprot:scpid59605/ scgid2629/ 